MYLAISCILLPTVICPYILCFLFFCLFGIVCTYCCFVYSIYCCSFFFFFFIVCPSFSFHQVAALKTTVATASADLDSLGEKKDQAEAAAERASARADALEAELRASAKALAEVREGLQGEVSKVARLTRDTAELEQRMESEAATAAAALAEVQGVRSELEGKVSLVGSGVGWGGFWGGARNVSQVEGDVWLF